jgi:hypothetical protein
MSVTTTWPPLAANARAVAAPIPLPPPTTSAVNPFNPEFIIQFIGRSVFT